MPDSGYVVCKSAMVLYVESITTCLGGSEWLCVFVVGEEN